MVTYMIMEMNGEMSESIQSSRKQQITNENPITYTYLNHQITSLRMATVPNLSMHLGMMKNAFFAEEQKKWPRIAIRM